MRSSVIYLFLVLSVLEEAFSGLRVQFHCPNLVLKNGKVKRRQRGRFVKFVCNTGYMLAGEKFSTCVVGEWDPLPPKCVRPTCLNKVTPPTNGYIYPTHSGAALHVYCKSGYQIRGPSDIYCDGRQWDNNKPICLPTNTKPKMFCDFEEEDICGWTHDLNHDFDWRRENYKTPSGSIGTGPSFDHTKGAFGDGYYMYIESSSRNENDTARLISPIYDKTNGEVCLEFFYHMYGATTGSLRVYVKKVLEDWNLNVKDAIFSKSGNQGDKWYRSFHSLGVITDEYQIVIEGIRGPGYVSDIAVDDVRITENCVYEEMTTTTEVLYSTESLLTVESCENRCGHKAVSNETLQIPCDCDQNCYDLNRCCPDYFDFCVSESSTDDYSSTTDIPNEIIVPTSKFSYVPSTVPSTKTPLTTRLAKPSPTTAVYVTTITTMRTTTPAKITNVPNPATNRITNTRPTIRFLTQPTQSVFVKKTIPTKSNKNFTTSKIIYFKPKKTDKEIDNNDVMDVPRPTDSDEELLLTSPLPDVNVEEKWLPSDGDKQLDTLFLGNFSERDKFLSVKAPESASYNVVLVVISVLGISILTTVIGIILVRRFRCNHRRMRSSNGDSQSDVRFLTNDEVLDFSLDKNYDSL